MAEGVEKELDGRAFLRLLKVEHRIVLPSRKFSIKLLKKKEARIEMSCIKWDVKLEEGERNSMLTGACVINLLLRKQ